MDDKRSGWSVLAVGLAVGLVLGIVVGAIAMAAWFNLFVLPPVGGI